MDPDDTGQSSLDDDEVNSTNKTHQKIVKVSILSQLQSFRRNISKSSTSLNSTPRNIQRHVQQPLQTAAPAGSSARLPLSDSEIVENVDNIHETESDVRQSCSTRLDVDKNGSGLEASSSNIFNESRPVNSERDDISDLSPNWNLNSSQDEVKNVIRSIDRGVVHQICSGQVIVTLSTAVKELVENSLDAGATKIDIRLVEYGSKLIEVSDNGSGIEESNFDGLALKHHTSKISEFEDLSSLSTFGFRGEALSSLCALSNLTVITRHKQSEQKIGHRIEYDNGGRISDKTRCAREIGTTISLKDLFHTLPVRHREFLKNLKREFHKMVNILYGYCLVVSGVRITCTNQLGNSGPVKVFGVPPYPSLKERIVALFGSKQFNSLVEIKQPDEVTEEILSDFGLNKQSYERKYELEGFISQPNQGRSSSDRQFYFINSRPCDPAKISRVVNEAYHQFSRHQNPFVCLQFKTNKEYVDVNVTPDKRTLYVQNEKVLLATLKAALLPVLTSSASSFGLDSANSLSLSQSQLSFTGVSQSYSASEELDNSLTQSASFVIDYGDQSSRMEEEENTSYENPTECFAPQFSSSSCRGGSTLPRDVVEKTNSFINRFNKGSSSEGSSASYKRARVTEETCRTSTKQQKLSNFVNRFGVSQKRSFGDRSDEHGDTDLIVEKNEDLDSGTKEIEIILDNKEKMLSNSRDSMNYNQSQIRSTDGDDEDIMYDDDPVFSMENNQITTNKVVSVKVNWKAVASFAVKQRNCDSSSTVNYARRFRAKIAPEDNNTAEEELKKQLSKDMFSQMKIVGQFNLGFIIVRNGPDLFIVDQHASDEKYNFEDLEKTTVLQGQLLIRPLDLELPAISENIIIDNMKAFQRNGFDFIISPDGEPTKRVKLSKIPYSKKTEFGKSDVEELVFMMEDATEGSFYRPTKVREMFASRACRKSVMIGTALSQKEMRSIVDHMGEMEQPWNCPHGRPTIRHLINLNLLPNIGDIKFYHSD